MGGTAAAATGPGELSRVAGGRRRIASDFGCCYKRDKTEWHRSANGLSRRYVAIIIVVVIVTAAAAAGLSSGCSL